MDSSCTYFGPYFFSISDAYPNMNEHSPLLINRFFSPAKKRWLAVEPECLLKTDELGRRGT